LRCTASGTYRIGRREFISLLGGAAVAWPLPLRAQQAGKLPTIGVLGPSTPAAWTPWVAAFVRRLGELGWIEGRTVAIEYRWAEGRSERMIELAAELVRLKPDVIVTAGTAVPALKQATSVIPIVFAIGRDPIAEGLVASLARPGGNVTGLSTQVTDLAGKRLELLREVVPGVRKLAVLTEVEDPAALLERREVEAAARKLGLTVVALDLRRPDQELAPAFEALKGRVDALYVGTGGLITLNRARIFALALAAHLPAISGLKVLSQAGSLMSYGTDYSDLYRRAGDYVDKILRGAKAADLPVEQPTKFDLVVNLTTAKALGLKIPEAFLLRADEVIE
jgi:putative ABC transport system substrate-binding protein